LKDDLDLSPLKMCSSMRYTCMPNIFNIAKVMTKVKVLGQNDRQTKNNIPPLL